MEVVLWITSSPNIPQLLTVGNYSVDSTGYSFYDAIPVVGMSPVNMFIVNQTNRTASRDINVKELVQYLRISKGFDGSLVGLKFGSRQYEG